MQIRQEIKNQELEKIILKMKPRIIFFILMMSAFSRMFAQSGIPLETEIKNIENAANRAGVSAEQRHDSLVRLAQLRQLSGDIEGAAKNWLDAAGAVPGQVDDDALLSCAYCLAAMGEWDRTVTALQPLLSKYVRARFLDTSVKAVKTGDLSALSMLAGNPEFSKMKNEIYFLLWKIPQEQEIGEPWRRRLIAEFPQSPEGRLAAGGNNETIVLRPSPFWFFLGKNSSQSETSNQNSELLEKTSGASVNQPEVIAVTPQLTDSNSAPQAAPATPSPQEKKSAGKLQTGLFRQLANAQAQIDSLKKAGFSSSLERRIVNGNEMWAVTVFAGFDINKSISDLRAVGFESFLVR